jgi:membrane-bound lytic murein transglycosylase D
MAPMFACRFLTAIVACLLILPTALAETVDDHPAPLQLSQQMTPLDALAAPAPAPPAAAPAPATPVPPVSSQPFWPPNAAPEIRDDLPRMPTVDLTTAPVDLWQRMRNGFGMPDLSSPLVADREAYYLNRPDMLRLITQRSHKYLFHIVEELERRGMPTELALLPMVESAYNPLAYSRSRALGMWQFIPSTGKNYKLDQNWWRDERRDIIASTTAALDYLQNLYEMHGDWHLALASYNWGENAVARAIAKNRARGLPTDYASLTMPTETRYYVPKLQALKNIIAQPELFGFLLDPLPNRPYFATVGMPGDMDVALAARLAEMPVKDFIALNPAYQRPMIHGAKDSQLVLPQDRLEVFNANLKTHTDQSKPLATWRTYQLRPREGLADVAKRHNLSLAGLKRLNGIGPRTKIHPGINLLVPGPDAQLADQLLDQLPKEPVEPRKAGRHGKKKAGAKGHHKTKSKGKAKPAAKGHRR